MNKQLNTIIDEVLSKTSDVIAVNLSTPDGFTHYMFRSNDLNPDDEKLSAVSSSLLSLSNAASKQLINSELINTVIEAKDGNLIIMKTTYLKKSAVLCFISGTGLILGKSRYFATQIAAAIAQIPVMNLTDS